MNGQWMGQYAGTNSGSVMVNLDDMGDHFEGVAFLVDANVQLPVTVAPLFTTDKASKFQIRVPELISYDHGKRSFDKWQSVRKLFPNVNFPTSAEVSGNWDAERLSFEWKTDIGSAGSCVLSRSRVDLPSDYTPRVFTWDEYKRHVSLIEGRRFLFRGQPCTKRLRTKFHRSGRAYLGRFMSEDLPTLYKHISAQTRHIFNLEIPDQNGAFYNLVQHHGYPTPLLDWTYSPYVAAFFAYRNLSKSRGIVTGEGEMVRIFILDRGQWKNDFEQLQRLDLPFPHLSILEFIAIENQRMIPQQAASSVTNVDDIESYIRSKEGPEKSYLQLIDLPARDRKIVMHELSYMGITAGSLFPGIDGACEELRERFFGD